MVCLQLQLELEIQSDPPTLPAVEQLLQDPPPTHTHPSPPLPSFGQVKTLLKHVKLEKAIGVDKSPIHGASYGMQEN